MNNLAQRQLAMFKLKTLVALCLTASLAACSGTASDGSTNTSTGSSSGGTTTPVSKTGVALSSSSASVGMDSPATVTATVTNEKGLPVPNALVTFSVDSSIGALKPSSGKVLTDAAGVARVLLSPASITAAGADTLVASVNIDKVAYSAEMTYQLGATSVTLGDITVGVGSQTLSAYGTTDIRVPVLSNGTPTSFAQSVQFASSCAASGRAVLDAEAVTVNGVAIASYRDKGCGGKDTITASINSGQTQKTVQIDVAVPTAVSLQYVSASPEVITLKGYAFAGRPDTSLVTFKVVDSNNNPIQGKKVNFTLDTNVGGVKLDNTEATTNSNGEAIATVIAGLVPTPVRVTATVAAEKLLSQSSGLSISTGLPDSDSFSMSADKWNIAGWNWDGAEAKITIRMADHFNNPVPDDTQVNFIASGGKIGSGTQGSCKTKDSQCSVTISSQEPRGGTVDSTNPTEQARFRGRVHIVAYALGEESFFEFNNNNKADLASELITSTGASSDLSEAFIDNNENSVFDAKVDSLVDFNGNGTYDGPDGFFNGTLCDGSFAKCGSIKSPAQRTLHVFAHGTVIFAGDTPARIELFDLGTGNPVDLGSPFPIGLCSTSFTFGARITDVNGNPLPAGTTVSFKVSDDGKVFPFGSSYEIPSTTIGSIGGGDDIKVQGANYFVFAFGADGTVSEDKCEDKTNGGVLYSEVTVPRPGGTTVTRTSLLALRSW